MSPKKLGLLEKVQRHFSRMLPDLKGAPYEISQKGLHLWTVENKRTCWSDWFDWATCLTFPPTQYRVSGRQFYSQTTQPTVSKIWLK